MIKLKNYRQLSEHYQSFLYQRFIDTSQSEKFGYPKVIDSIEISSKTESNITQLLTLIFDIAEQLLAPGGQDQTVFQPRIPAKYIYLEEALEEYRHNRKKSILTEKEYKKRDLIQEIFQGTNQNSFRDHVELQQATKWLHENGSIKEQD
ncbi:unnamed protein product [Rotaria sp. Silwood1]|nr:unnamed protein product [Rotaria sp. Silwood1]CAF1647145.1 unnamed protein product [Rotaria sp. Silwood1]CAF3919226.1 unnamed protein product [Rotaria sp. Silwood1]